MPMISSPFGNGTDTGSGGNVNTALGTPHNFMGARRSGGAQGPEKVTGSIEQLVLFLDGALINDLGATTAGANPLVPLYLPAGATIRDVYYDGETAFTLTGGSPTILIGTSGSEVTNGLVISQAVAQSTNTARLTSTLTGTWTVNTPLQARTRVSIVLGGAGPGIDRLGKGKVTIEFWRPNNATNY